MRIKKGDYVQVISGEEKGKKGRVLRVMPRKDKIIVEGINYIHKHMRKTQKNPQGGRVQKEAPVHVSNVMMFCPNAQSPTRTFYRYEEVKEQQDKQSKESTGEKVKRVKVRYSRKSNRQI